MEDWRVKLQGNTLINSSGLSQFLSRAGNGPIAESTPPNPAEAYAGRCLVAGRNTVESGCWKPAETERMVGQGDTMS